MRKASGVRRHHVSDRRRFTALRYNLDYCAICGKPRENLHEVFFGTANRQKSKDWGMVMPLCAYHHRLIHRNAELRLKTQQDAQRKFEEAYGHEMFMKIFGKNYL